MICLLRKQGVKTPSKTYFKEKSPDEPSGERENQFGSIPHSQEIATTMARLDGQEALQYKTPHTAKRRRRHEFCFPLELYEDLYEVAR